MQRHEKLQLLQHFCVVLAFVNQGLFTPQESQSCRRLKRKMFHLLVGKTRHYKKNLVSYVFHFPLRFPNVHVMPCGLFTALSAADSCKFESARNFPRPPSSIFPFSTHFTSNSSRSSR